MCLPLLFDNNSQWTSIIWDPGITFRMFCWLGDCQYLSSCFSFNILYFWPWRRSVMQLWAEISMRRLHYPICITRNWWPSVDAMLTVIFRMGLRPCHFLNWLQWQPIRLFCITVNKSLTNCLVYNTNNLWGSIDINFHNAKLILSLAHLLIKGANMSVTHSSKHIPFHLLYIHYQKALTLCWGSL